MAKGLNQVNLVFTADTAQARRAIQELQSSLNSIATGAALGGGEMKITKEMGLLILDDSNFAHENNYSDFNISLSFSIKAITAFLVSLIVGQK